MTKHDEALEAACKVAVEYAEKRPPGFIGSLPQSMAEAIAAYVAVVPAPETKGLVEEAHKVAPLAGNAGRTIRALADALEALTAKCAVLEAERDQARGELRMVDELLARRPALADSDGRIAKIGKAISYAGRTDAAERENAQLRARASRIREETI